MRFTATPLASVVVLLLLAPPLAVMAHPAEKVYRVGYLASNS